MTSSKRVVGGLVDGDFFQCIEGEQDFTKRRRAVKDLAIHVANAASKLCAPYYTGPLVTAGGFWRDGIVGNQPKDLDIFILESYLEKGSARDVARSISRLSPVPSLTPTIEDGRPSGTLKMIPCYGKWSQDVSLLMQAMTPLLPIDIVVLNDASLLEWMKRQKLQLGDRENLDRLFLRYVLERVDLRMNHIGANANSFALSPKFREDLEAKRLVVQWERIVDAEPDEFVRIVKRIQRLLLEKFQGWTTWTEDKDGEIVESRRFRWRRGTGATEN